MEFKFRLLKLVIWNQDYRLEFKFWNFKISVSYVSNISSSLCFHMQHPSSASSSFATGGRCFFCGKRPKQASNNCLLSSSLPPLYYQHHKALYTSPHDASVPTNCSLANLPILRVFPAIFLKRLKSAGEKLSTNIMSDTAVSQQIAGWLICPARPPGRRDAYNQLSNRQVSHMSPYIMYRGSTHIYYYCLIGNTKNYKYEVLNFYSRTNWTICSAFKLASDAKAI